MRDSQATTTYLKDYRVPEFLIDKTDLRIDLEEQQTTVSSTLQVRRNPASDKRDGPLSLHGQDMELLELKLGGEPLAPEDYVLGPQGLNIIAVPGGLDSFTVQCRTRIHPETNTSLEGLYKSRTMFCTQCEAEGFRKITYYLDRPDVMSEFTTTLVADQDRYPVLLSNGNLVDEGRLEDGRHFATWHDPFKKPAYLFAVVAGDLDFVEDHFVTCSGRTIRLRIYVEGKDLDKCDHAMRSLKLAMKWDEDNYGREYDLDVFNIVAVDDFNMGAMENKGLNIFNTSCVLANPAITTDDAFQRVEGVVAHEYFHNWSGNRVTCRDWFQLSLKEGFTVFRDAEFSADMNSRAVKRIEDVKLLRTLQFAEDGGPMAHPVQPDAYLEINNFYTLTVYEKGAEVVRMVHTLLGAEAFRRGSDLYFERHDGQAATIDEFVCAMEDASGRDLQQFKRWYKQAGTPELAVVGDYDAEGERYTLSFTQSCRATPECKTKLPFVIPVAMGLMADSGALPLTLVGEESSSPVSHRVLELTESQQSFTFTGIKEKPVPSLLRGFSAPVRLHFPYTREDLAFIMSRDVDGFNRWDAAQQLATTILLEQLDAVGKGKASDIDPLLENAFAAVLADDNLDPAVVALMLSLPSEAALHETLAARQQLIAVQDLHQVRQRVRAYLADKLYDQWLAVYQRQQSADAYRADASQVASRSLKNLALSYLLGSAKPEAVALAEAQYRRQHNMTDVLAALTQLCHSSDPQAQRSGAVCLEDFYQRWQGEALVVNQWLSLQASNPNPHGLERVQALLSHEAYDGKNPNKLRALIGAFAMGNHVQFHREDGAAYRFLAEQILSLNQQNPQMAARLLMPLTKWRRYPVNHQEMMKAALHTIQACPELSPDVFEVVQKSLA